MKRTPARTSGCDRLEGMGPVVDHPFGEGEGVFAERLSPEALARKLMAPIIEEMRQELQKVDLSKHKR